MDTSNLGGLLDQLDDNADDLEQSLATLFKTALSDTAAKLPLLDKAKLYVLVTYSLESIIFSYLRLNGVNAREHAVFNELARVRNYFEKIKHVETSGSKRENLSLDKQAAARFVKHALSGNEKYDLDRAERLAKEKAKAHIKFEQLSNKRKADDAGGLVQEPDDVSTSGGEPSLHNPGGNVPANTKRRSRNNRKNDLGPGEGNSSGIEQGNTGAESKRVKSEGTARTKSNRPPKSHNAAFEALLKGPLPKIENAHSRPSKKEKKRARE
ncbi:hypothetical protein L228DRAFT_250220 [Xylona heveae TC161]|uniref:Exosome complex protein n=1 Tax=Xylona heveae (strain CBS 132557 / TC161) TaxID=1328760 RepID=A0A165AI19_XYLHT|nr:hypothetical protein L228DRAFT_250220 [Xylona heveae TC161]KZF20510.1 hypothetical protein L228DRAFT_250220 [Xylona heveae TC161]